jgi:hypothetical protein
MVAFCVFCVARTAWAHVGSKDVFETVHAGGYTLYVTVRPPNVIPGIATVEVRSTGATLSNLHITPLPVTGEASKHPPAADLMTQSASDSAFFTGAVWIMGSGAWQIRLRMDGAGGQQMASVPVIAVPVSTLKMDKGMIFTLAALGLFLLISMAGVVGASFREARLKPGAAPDTSQRRSGLIATAVSVAIMVGIVVLGGWWWSADAAEYSKYVTLYGPPSTTATLTGDQLDLNVKRIHDGERRFTRSNSDYLPDHGKLMHLYAIREPEMDAAFHLHPQLVAAGDFRLTLPAMPPGHYKLYGDVVHASGFPETLQAEVDIPAGLAPGKLDSDDASAAPAPLSQGELGPAYKLPGGYTMVWDRPANLSVSTPYAFKFTLLDPQGKPASGMEPYLGMAGHAAFVKTDGTVFAHTHPEGSAAMADVALANESMGSDPMAGMNDMSSPIAPEVEFPYGFPTPGRYRIFVQMKHDNTVETGVFDAIVK